MYVLKNAFKVDEVWVLNMSRRNLETKAGHSNKSLTGGDQDAAAKASSSQVWW